MKHFLRTVGVAGSLALATLGVAHANDDVLMDQCLEQFVASQFAAFDGKITIRKDAGMNYSGPLMLRSYNVEISAIDPATGETIASATCKPKKDGLLVSIKSTTGSSLKLVKVVKAEPALEGDAG